MPDKIIAFDELPEDFLSELEMQNEKAMLRYWKDFIGTRKRTIQIKPYVDPMTRQLIKCEPIVEESPFTWVVDWEINSNVDAWSRICAYVRQNVQEGFRLLDKIEDMAKPLAPNVSEQITLEPEDVVIIPLKKVESKAETSGNVPAPSLVAESKGDSTCVECNREFANKHGLFIHRKKRHPEKISV